MTKKSTLLSTKRFFSLLLALFSFASSFAQVDAVRPTVISTSPDNWAITINTGIYISATFSEAMNPSTINSTTFELRNALNNDLVPGTVIYNAATRTVTLYPTNSLNSFLFTAKVKGGSLGVKDIAGNAMISDYSWYFIMIPLIDLTPPVVLSVSPSDGATGVSTIASATAVLSEPMLASSINTSTVELRNASNVLIPAVVSYNAANRMIVLTPSAPLASSAFYRVTIKGGNTGVKDDGSVPMAANYTWSFTTSGPPDFTPPAVTSVSPVNGATNVNTSTTVSAIFSEAMNASTINTSTVELRNASNALVTATIAYNAATKTATITPSATLTYSTVYTATVKGGIPGVKDIAGISMLNNYSWSFTTMAPPDLIPPTIASVSPVNGATAVNVNTTVSAVFSEAMNASTINTSTMELRNSSNVLVSASVAYNTATKTATLTPLSPLANLTGYKATVKGGAAGVKDVAGNFMTNEYNWTFTTISTGITIFQTTDVPVVPLNTDQPQPIEIGVRFRSSQNGYIKGIRFYKGEGNTGTHIGHLWTNTGTLLASVTFVEETASGWQQVMFANPVPINAGVTYVASYFSSLGYYSYTNSYFTTAVVNGPLRALADGEDGGNGVYGYSPNSVFPTGTFLSTNYWADVVFASGPDQTAPLITAVTPINGTVNVSANTTLTASFNEAMNASTINTSTFELRSTSNNAAVAATISYNAVSGVATLTPAAPLAYTINYTAKVKGGASGVKDISGNYMTNDYSWTFTTTDAPLLAPTEGPGGPILVISASGNPFSRYAVEILRAEGLNEFAAADISTVNSTMLNSYDVVVLGDMPVNAEQVTLLTNWVNAGGTLIAFKPNPALNSLMGVTTAAGSLTDKYLLVNTASGPGAGIVNQTIQYHGTANLYTLAGASSLATLYSTASTATNNPAVTLRIVGSNGGRAVAFAYDLAKSIIYTRQGNPAWAGQKRDGQIDPIRSDDLFFPDWIDFNKIAIPQADEQQRLLANIILQSNLHRKPLPRFWYLPRDLKAAIVMTGDDHSNNGTQARFNQYKTLGPNTMQDVADWKAVRGTAYMYPNTPMTSAQATAFQADGFEIALHPTTNCLNFTDVSLAADFTAQLAEFAGKYPGLSPSATNRTHCLVWSDWATQPKIELQKGIRLDATYYYWPEVWMQNRPGMFTGSGMPMRFADLDGSLIDVYQAPTQMTDETNMNCTSFCNAVLDKAIGIEGYYGVFTANMHNDAAASPGADAIIASAQARQIPIISAKQMLTWLDGRNNSSFGNMVWNGSQLTFTLSARGNARNIRAMLPLFAETGQLISITRNGSPLVFTVQTIKGMQYAFFGAETGTSNYVATYNLSARIVTPPATDITPEAGRSSGTMEAAKTTTAEAVEKAPAPSKLYVNVMPNPTVDYVNVVISSNDANPVTVRVRDISGRILETHDKVTSVGVLRIGQNWAAGTYIAEIIQGNERKTVKIIKVN